MLPNKTFFLRFIHRDSSEIEEQEYTTIHQAFDALRMFLEEDSAEMYSRIELSAYDWEQRISTPIATLDLHT